MAKEFSNLMFEYHYEDESVKDSKTVVFRGGHPSETQLNALLELFRNNKESGFCIIPDVLEIDKPNGHKVAAVCTYYKQDRKPTTWMDVDTLIERIEKMNAKFARKLYNAF